MQYSSLMCPMIAAQFLVPVQACCDNIAKDSFCYVHQAFMPQGRYYWSIEMSHDLHQNGISQAINQSIVIILSQCFDQCGSIFRKGSVCKQYVPLMNVNDFNYKLYWLLKIHADIRKRGEKYRAWNPTINSIIKWTPLQLRKAACHMYLWNYVWARIMRATVREVLYFVILYWQSLVWIFPLYITTSLVSGKSKNIIICIVRGTVDNHGCESQ